MYNLIIYKEHRTVLYPSLSYRECISKLVSSNVKTGFKLDNVVAHMHKKVNQLRLSELS